MQVVAKFDRPHATDHHRQVRVCGTSVRSVDRRVQKKLENKRFFNIFLALKIEIQTRRVDYKSYHYGSTTCTGLVNGCDVNKNLRGLVGFLARIRQRSYVSSVKRDRDSNQCE